MRLLLVQRRWARLHHRRSDASQLKQLSAAGMTMLVVSHEMGFAKAAADRMFFMDEATIVEEGTPHEMLTQPKTARARQFLQSVTA